VIERYEVQSIKDIFSDKSRFKLYTQFEYMRIEYLTLTNEQLSIEFNKSAIEITEEDLSLIKAIEAQTKHEIGAFLVWFSTKHVNNKYLHSGLTSSDLLDSALNLQIQEARLVIKDKFEDLYSAMYSLMNRYKDLKFMARTHGQLAKESTFGHFLNTRIQHLERAYNLLHVAAEELNFVRFLGPVGQADIETNSFTEYVNSFYLTKTKDIEMTQIVPRDLYANLIYAIVALGISVEKIALEIRLMSQSGIEELSESFSSNQIGSSAMPHKKNPIVCENISGLVRLLKSYLQPALDNINLWGYRDMTHSSVERIIIPDSFHLIANVLSKMTDVIDTLNVNEEKISENRDKNTLSTLILSELTPLLGYVLAYRETQCIIFDAKQTNTSPLDLLYERFQVKLE